MGLQSSPPREGTTFSSTWKPHAHAIALCTGKHQHHGTPFQARNMPQQTPQPFTRHQRAEKISLFPLHIFLVPFKLKAKPSGEFVLRLSLAHLESRASSSFHSSIKHLYCAGEAKGELLLQLHLGPPSIRIATA